MAAEPAAGGQPRRSSLAALVAGNRIVVAAAAVVVALELWVAVSAVSGVVRAGHEGLGARSNLVRDADLDPLAPYASTEALALARSVIPPDATYTVVIGKSPPLINPGATRAVFRLWLLPRRYTRKLADARWIVAYHASSESLGVPYSREIGLGPHANLVEVSG
jgi:hypothetical protein